MLMMSEILENEMLMMSEILQNEMLMMSESHTLIEKVPTLIFDSNSFCTKSWIFNRACKEMEKLSILLRWVKQMMNGCPFPHVHYPIDQQWNGKMSSSNDSSNEWLASNSFGSIGLNKTLSFILLHKKNWTKSGAKTKMHQIIYVNLNSLQ